MEKLQEVLYLNCTLEVFNVLVCLKKNESDVGSWTFFLALTTTDPYSSKLHPPYNASLYLKESAIRLLTKDIHIGKVCGMSQAWTREHNSRSWKPECDGKKVTKNRIHLELVEGNGEKMSNGLSE